MTGFDTETHEGRAVLMATPRQYVLFPRSFERCMEFLFGIGDQELICWNADYDAGAMLKFLPPGLLLRLHQLGRWSWETKLRGWSVPGRVSLHYVPHKFLRIRAGSKTLTIYDLRQFYNMKLEKAARQFLGKSKLDPGVGWNELKDALESDPVKRARIIDYCQMDAQLVEELAEQTRQKFGRIGIPFDRPVSCASLSYRVFKNPLTEGFVPRPTNEEGRKSFRGGMIECLRTGFFKQAWYIDLRSAYPSNIRELTEAPEIWVPIDGGQLRPDASYASIDCTVRIPRNWPKGWLPFVPERKSLLFYPVGRWRVHLDLFTYKQVERFGLVERIHGGVQGLGFSDARPFHEDVERLFAERAADAQKKWAVKIILNSLFGKFAEAIEYKIPGCDLETLSDLRQLNLAFERKERFTNHTNFFFAADVTARTRWRLIADLKPADVISYATDGVFLKRLPADLDFGPRLGQWSPPERVRDLVVVGSGVYCYKAKIDGEWKTQTRFRGFGVNLDLYGLLDRRAKTVPIELQRNQPLGSSVMTGRWDLFNIIRKEERILNVNFDRKRRWEREWVARDLLARSFESDPWLMVEGNAL